MIASLSKRLWLLNLLLLAVAVFFGVSLARDVTRSRPLPPPPVARGAPGAAPSDDAPAPGAEDKLDGYNVIVAKYLFNPSRAEGGPATPAGPATPPPSKPTLLGVVVDGATSRAYLEDASTKRVFGYKIGDTVSGGRLDQITDDKVVIVGPDGAIDVLLRDPSKPKPPGAPAPGTAAQPGGAGGQAVSPSVPGQPVPGQPPIIPRALRRLPVNPPPPVSKQ
jgi:hypothetical protein